MRMFTELFKYPETFASLPGDFTYWHKNRKKYAVWAIEPDLPELTERFNQARAHLAPFLLPENPRQIHITLGQCGFIAAQKNHEDDYHEATFLADIEHLKAFEQKALRLNIQGVLTSYAIAPFFPVIDTHQDLLRFHQKLTHTANEDYTFVPHVTVGLYADAWATQQIYQSLITFPTLTDLSFELSKIKLLSYNPVEVGGKLTQEGYFDLVSKQFFVQSGLFD